MTEKKALRKGQGRREFYACYDRIKELAERGCNMTLIFEELTKEGLITMSYDAFYDSMTQRKRKRKVGQLAAVEGKPLYPPQMPLTPQPMPLWEATPPVPQAPMAAPALPAQQFPISHQGHTEKPRGRPRRKLQGMIDEISDVLDQNATQPVLDDDPEYAKKKRRVTGEDSAKGD